MPSLVDEPEANYRSDTQKPWSNGYAQPSNGAGQKPTNGYAHVLNQGGAKAPSEAESLYSFVSEPEPPENLWDSDDVQYLEKVVCHIEITIQHIDPKNGQYEGRLNCNWFFRTLKQDDRTEPRHRVPGIRTPTLTSEVEESRVWRHEGHDSYSTIAWQGQTVSTFSGFEVFEVHDFPFDRQVVNLALFEFVWREQKDTDVFYEAMKVVRLTVETISMLPEWDTFHAVIDPKHIYYIGSGPSYCTRFNFKLRIQRKAGYYILQIFLVSTLILLCSLLPMILEPGDSFIGDRLALHSSGLLTLISFKFGIQDELPAVPYKMFVSMYLTYQIVTVVSAAAESVVSYRLVLHGYLDQESMAWVEDALLFVILAFWLFYFLYVAFGKQRSPWSVVLANQDGDKEPIIWKF